MNVLNRKQARWAQEMATYDFKIVYGPENGGSEDQPITTILSENHFLREFISPTKISKK
jgi:hypothetical protein